jgi:hypothetical protein
MSEAILPRRSFLRSLVTLPMLGGGVSLIGAPTAIAEPVTDDLLWGYKTWLHYEHRMLSSELAGHDHKRTKEIERWLFTDNAASHWHFTGANAPSNGGWPKSPQPSTRAALVLSAVGCDWRG